MCTEIIPFKGIEKLSGTLDPSQKVALGRQLVFFGIGKLSEYIPPEMRSSAPEGGEVVLCQVGKLYHVIDGKLADYFNKASGPVTWGIRKYIKSIVVFR